MLFKGATLMVMITFVSYKQAPCLKKKKLCIIHEKIE